MSQYTKKAPKGYFPADESNVVLIGARYEDAQERVPHQAGLYANMCKEIDTSGFSCRMRQDLHKVAVTFKPAGPKTSP